jgi:hypothetical protein
MQKFKVLPAKPEAVEMAKAAGDEHDERTLISQRGHLRQYEWTEVHKSIMAQLKVDYVRIRVVRYRTS